MKKILKATIAVLFTAGALTSCSLDEWNPSAVDLDKAYSTPDAWEGLINYSYDAIYYFYGKVDGISPMEMGTDLWTSESYEVGYTRYTSALTPSSSTLTTMWNGLYATVNYCNTAIDYAPKVEGYADEETRNAKVAEAYFLRGWSYWHLVELFGNVVLTTEPSSKTGINTSPVRSTEAEIYDQIISDFEYAVEHLPVTPGERGRASKKAALGMLAKAYLQRTRLNEPEAAEYARLALETAKELIDNAADYGCGLYESTADKSGFAELFDGLNNKNNKEFLFVEAVSETDYANTNPDGSKGRGRTRQYYEMKLGATAPKAWGMEEAQCYMLSRANSTAFKPTKYLMTELFEPVKDPADTRFATSFFTEYYCDNWAGVKITAEMAETYAKDPSVVDKEIKMTNGQYLLNTEYYFGTPKVENFWGSAVINMEDEDGDGWLDGLSVYTPNYIIPADEKAKMPFLALDPSDLFTADGKWVSTETGGMGTFYKDVYPSLRKFSAVEYTYNNNQAWLGDFVILRLGDIYLVAAEAALRYNNDQSTALQYVQAIRNRAAVTGRQNEMAVTAADMTLDFITAERGRELAGEQWRWYDLKRLGKLNSTYLMRTNPDIIAFDEAKHQVRPIPQSFLDAIANAAEFGNNGY